MCVCVCVLPGWLVGNLVEGYFCNIENANFFKMLHEGKGGGGICVILEDPKPAANLCKLRKKEKRVRRKEWKICTYIHTYIGRNGKYVLHT